MNDKNQQKKTDLPKKRIIGSSVKPCIHDLGISRFIKVLRSADANFAGFDLGVASIDKIIGVLKETKQPGLIMGLSYRLGVVGLKEIIEKFIERIFKEKLDPKNSGIKYAFGSTIPGANLVRAMTGQPIRKDPFEQEEQKYDLKEVAEEYKNNPKFQNFFALIADTKTKKQEIIELVKPQTDHLKSKDKPAQKLIDRIKEVRKNEGRAVRRVHIGIAGELEKTLEAIKKITKEKVWDIISIAPDQHAQQFLYHFITGKKNPKDYPFAQGGCPIRSKKDLIKLKKASQCGNYPLMRIYSGTDKLIEIGKIFDETIDICFPAVPIFWYNQLDGRGPIAIKEGIAEHQKVIRFWAKRGKPVEINDPHQWQLRECSDDTYVVDHVLCAIIAKLNGVKDYIMQMMFNLPPETSPKNDLAKMQAAYELIKILEDENFRIIKEVRGGLSAYPDDLDKAAGHLSATTLLQLFMKPDIIHIVSKSEAHHEAGSDDIIQSCKHVEGVEELFRLGEPVLKEDKFRKLELKRNAVYTLLNIAVIGEYKGKYKNKISIENFDEFLRTEEECEKVLKDIVSPNNYLGGKKCNLINADVLDSALRAGFLQAPVIADIDKRYTMVSKCETEMINGACRTVKFNEEKVDNEIERIKKAMQYLKEQVMGARVQRKGEMLTRGIPKEKVLQARNELMIPKFENKKVLVVDFGSTFTKLAIFNTSNIEKIKFNYVPTTVDNLERSLAHGLGILNKCLKDDEVDETRLKEELKKEMEKYDIRLACSSAKGGLKIVTVSAVKEESGKAAELAAFKAGGKILASYNGKLTNKQTKNIYQKDQPELILLTGGVDRGGNTEIVVHNAKKLAEYIHLTEYAKYGLPIVYAGTKDAHQKIAYIFAQKKKIKIKWAENIMPEINEFNIDAVEDAISTFFKEIIVKGKGFDKVQKYFQLGLVPTPAAALWGINLLASGYGEKNPGLGDIFAIDIGGCTTDVFRVLFRKNPLYQGADENKRTRDLEPNLPPVTRRVEGKFGLSFNAENLMLVNRWKEGKINYFINSEFQKNYPNYKGKDSSILSQFFNPKNKKAPIDIAGYLKYISTNPDFIPKTREENTLNALIANEILKACTKNNCGRVEVTETYYLQKGINFLNMPCTVVLIGGTVYHKCQENTPEALRDLKIIAQGALFNPEEPYILRPQKDKVKVLADKDYLIAIIGGRYGKIDPKRALQIMKKHLKEIKL